MREAEAARGATLRSGNGAEGVIAQRDDGRQDHDREEDAGGEERVAAERLEAREAVVDPIAEEEDAEEAVDDGRDAGEQLDEDFEREAKAAGQVFGDKDGG